MKRTYQPSKLRRARKHGFRPNSDKNLKTSRNSRLLVFVLSESEFRGAFCYNRKKKNSEEKEDHADF